MNNIKVAVRVRPSEEPYLKGLELLEKRILCNQRVYDYDLVLPVNATQDDVWRTCLPTIESVKEGCNCTVMLYGQTGSGKTHTMLGGAGESSGVAFKAIDYLLSFVLQRQGGTESAALSLSILEIYNEGISDMLSDKKTEITLVNGVPRSIVKLAMYNKESAKAQVSSALTQRQVCSTAINDRSSRSHVIVILELVQKTPSGFEAAQCFLVDLAGSECIKRSHATGTAATEAGMINKSLLALRSVVSSLASAPEGQRTHIPYRDSKLTELLQDSIGGTARTLLIACIAPSCTFGKETESTLEYAANARKVRNVANSKSDKAVERIRLLEGEVDRLKMRLQEKLWEQKGYYISPQEHDRIVQLEDSNRELNKSLLELRQVQRMASCEEILCRSQVEYLLEINSMKDNEIQQAREAMIEGLKKFENSTALMQKQAQCVVSKVSAAITDDVSVFQSSCEGWIRGFQSDDFVGSYLEEMQKQCERMSDAFQSTCREILLMKDEVTQLIGGKVASHVAEGEKKMDGFLSTMTQFLAEWKKDNHRAAAEVVQIVDDYGGSLSSYVARAPSQVDVLAMRHALENSLHPFLDRLSSSHPIFTMPTVDRALHDVPQRLMQHQKSTLVAGYQTLSSLPLHHHPSTPIGAPNKDLQRPPVANKPSSTTPQRSPLISRSSNHHDAKRCRSALAEGTQQVSQQVNLKVKKQRK